MIVKRGNSCERNVGLFRATRRKYSEALTFRVLPSKFPSRQGIFMERDGLALPKYLHQPEGRTLEFKENCNNMQGIIKSVIAFANTAGGVLVIGVRDQTREIIGVEDPLAQEERLTSVISDSIAPLILPDIDIQTVKNRELLVIMVPHTAGPFFLKGKGEEEGVYVRFGSTNRKADGELLLSLRLVARNRTFDESPQPGGRIDEPTVEKTFKELDGAIHSDSWHLHRTSGKKVCHSRRDPSV